jgi:hypothetical protein
MNADKNHHTVNMANEADLESKLARDVRSYIRASRNGDSTEADEALRWTCTGFEWLLGTLLEGSDGWSGWIDGVVPATDVVPGPVSVISTVELTIRGRVDWMKKGRGPSWIEPFFGSVEISQDVDAIVSYDLRFADAARDLGEVPFGKHIRRADWFFPDKWLFTFSKGSK